MGLGTPNGTSLSRRKTWPGRAVLVTPTRPGPHGSRSGCGSGLYRNLPQPFLAPGSPSQPGINNLRAIRVTSLRIESSDNTHGREFYARTRTGQYTIHFFKTTSTQLSVNSDTDTATRLCDSIDDAIGVA